LGAFVLLAPGVFVLLPLGLLLALSLPRPSRLWVWILGCGLWTVVWLLLPGSLAEQTLKGWVVVAAGTFVLLALRPGRRAFDAALGAALLATVAVGSWLMAYRVPVARVTDDALRLTWAAYRQMGDAVPGWRAAASEASDAAASLATIFPAGAILFGIAGLLLAWRWYHYLDHAPLGTPPGPFREFRFSDHLIWLLVLGMTGTVAQVAGVLHGDLTWPVNLLVVSGALYGVRGLAILWAGIGGWPGPVLLVVAFAVLFLAPFAFTGLLGVGLADTWLDFRRRAADATGE
jgi:hypothetical protein